EALCAFGVGGSCPDPRPCHRGSSGPRRPRAGSAGWKRRAGGLPMSTITTLYKGDMNLEAVMGENRLVIDVPKSIGGKGRGPTPSDLFVASLGSCVAAFVADYCERVGLDTTGLSVDVSFEAEGDPDCPTCLTDLEVVVNLPNAEAGDREEAIRRVAEHCPVHETVEFSLKEIDFQIRDRTKLARPAGTT